MARNYLLFISILILTVSLFTPGISQTPSQPPVVTDTLYVGHISWGPRRADPVRAYDTYSCELIFNVYDTLIAMNGELYWDFVPLLATNVPAREDITKTVTNTTLVNMTNPTGSQWSDGSACIGMVDNNPDGTLGSSDVLYMVEADGSYRTWFVQSLNAMPPVNLTLWRGSYGFNIRTDPVINFVNETGHVVDTFDVRDAEYSFERGLVQDQSGSPMWMFYKPFFDQMNSDFFDSNVTEPTAMSLAHLIDDAIEVSENKLTINVGVDFPNIAFLQVICNAWSSMCSKEFSMSIGCWNGDLYTDSNGDGYPDWWSTVRRLYRSPYDTTGAYRWVGTGPYLVTLFDSANYIVKLSRNANYWNGWPAPSAKSFLETVEIYYNVDWTHRPNPFTDCTLDVCDVPKTYIWTLLDENGEPLIPEIKTITNLVRLSIDVVVFTFTINLEGYWGRSFIGSEHFPDGIPANFFNNTHVRKAFAYAFNHTKYLQEEYFGEALIPSTPLIQGLHPDYHTGISGYDVNFDLAEAELKNAIFNGQNVWEMGFTFTIPYPYWDSCPKWAEIIRDFFINLSTYDDRPPEWPDFIINIQPIYPYLDLYWPEPDEIPVVKYGWLCDFADADNFLRPYMHSKGDFSYFQNYTAANGWGSRKDELLDLAVKTPDGPKRAALYAELEQNFVDDCPSFPIAQPLGRKWMKYWVRGWYYNPLYLGDYRYNMWKEDTCWFDVTGEITGVSDGVCNMRDITYLILRFNAHAPSPGAVDPRWVGTYGYGGVDPYGDRISNMRDITHAILHFNHRNQP